MCPCLQTKVCHWQVAAAANCLVRPIGSIFSVVNPFLCVLVHLREYSNNSATQCRTTRISFRSSRISQEPQQIGLGFTWSQQIGRCRWGTNNSSSAATPLTAQCCRPSARLSLCQKCTVMYHSMRSLPLVSWVFQNNFAKFGDIFVSSWRCPASTRAEKKRKLKTWGTRK